MSNSELRILSKGKILNVSLPDMLPIDPNAVSESGLPISVSPVYSLPHVEQMTT